MRIGIKTLPLHTNYGGILQAYALSTMLKNLGHSVVVVEKEQTHVGEFRVCIHILIQIFRKYLLRKDVKQLNTFAYNNYVQYYIRQNTDQFIKQHIIVQRYKKINECANDNFDAIVVGSDQVWRPQYTKSIEENFLSFAKQWHIKRIAYAASFGVDTWEFSEQQTTNCKSLAKLFSNISVREYGGINLCKEYLDVKAVKVLDPTLLLEASSYEKLFSPSDGVFERDTLLTYVLHNNKDIQDYIDKMSRHNRLEIYTSNNVYRNNPSKPLELRIQPSVEQWLSGIKNAQLVITDSFHACVFSIIFNTPFIVVGVKDIAFDRFDSLLNDFGLPQCLCNNYKMSDIPKIDWDTVNKKRELLKQESIAFLENSLS